MVLRAYQRTIRRLVLMDVMQIPIDAPKPFHERPVKARKPPDQRKKIHSRTDWPKGRKIPNRKPENVT